MPETTSQLTYRGHFLRIAAELEALAGGLDTSSDECKCCGTNRYRAFEEELTARKLLGWADSLQNLTTNGRKSTPPAAFLERHAPPMPAVSEPRMGLSERTRYDRAGLKSDTLWRRLVEGDDMRAVYNDAAGLVDNNEAAHPSAARVLSRLGDFHRAKTRTT